MTKIDFFKHPILNSPYDEPTRHHVLDENGQPTEEQPREERRRSDLYTPVPKAKRTRKNDAQRDMLDEADQQYNPTPIINEIRQHVKSWRELPNSGDWGVTPATRRLLDHWRSHKFASIKPFFCQREAAETIIWLTEVARGQRQYKRIWDHLEGGNVESNPALFRLAMKMATGAGKTTVMAMLIAWQTINAVRAPSSKSYSKGFLIIAPGITIRDRLRVLDPSDPDSYYEKRELVPSDLMHDITAAKVVVTNYHAFQRRETTKLSKGTRAAIEGRRQEKVNTLETEGEMLRRSIGDLFTMKNIVVINDEAHHCYREKPGTDDVKESKGDDKKEAKENNEAARLWISGIETAKRKIGVRAIYDLSATPFFLRGSGYREGTLFPWTITDFSLMDAIECGIVKLPRVPILDNMPTLDGKPIYRNLWDHIGKKLPKKGRAKSGGGNPEALAEVTPLITALRSLYAHYEKTDEQWRAMGHEVPPVFIVVCNNTTTSQIVHDWIAGYETPETEKEPAKVVPGQLKLFNNYDEFNQRLEKPNTLLIDSAQIDTGEGLDPAFRAALAPEIEQFRQEKIQREGAPGEVKITDEDLLREVMNTVGEKGRLGESIRCVVSVSMLTEGWDANTVTHILGVRAFGTQLLCEQVVGRGLRRKSYELNQDGLFDVEYADIMGIPFDFTAKATVAPPTAPKPVTRVQARRERAHLAIRFPRVEGYRTALPDEQITAQFTEDSKFRLNPSEIGATKTYMSGVVGEQQIMSPEAPLDEYARPNSIAFRLTKHLLATKYQDEGGMNMSLFPQVKRVVTQWLDQEYLVCEAAGTFPAMVTWPGVIDKACERIFLACQKTVDGENRVTAVIDTFNPEGDTRFVNFTTSKPCFVTDAKRCHVSHVVEDSTWEAELARICEEHPKVLSYVKNQGLGFDVPYRNGPVTRRYVPDFIVRLDDGRGEIEPLNLILEVKGYRDEDAKLKAQTMNELWVPGVNNLHRFGRWAFEEFTEVFGMEKEFAELVKNLEMKAK